MWLQALHGGVQNLLVFESDGDPTCIESFLVGGNAADFVELVAELPWKAPSDWYVIMLDKGDWGSPPNPPAVSVIRPASSGGNRAYTLIPWAGRGVVGVANGSWSVGDSSSGFPR